jgi:hypothetical protein
LEVFKRLPLGHAFPLSVFGLSENEACSKLKPEIKVPIVKDESEWPCCFVTEDAQPFKQDWVDKKQGRIAASSRNKGVDFK